MRISDWSSDVCSSDLRPLQQTLQCLALVELSLQRSHGRAIDGFRSVEQLHVRLLCERLECSRKWLLGDVELCPIARLRKGGRGNRQRERGCECTGVQGRDDALVQRGRLEARGVGKGVGVMV